MYLLNHEQPDVENASVDAAWCKLYLRGYHPIQQAPVLLLKSVYSISTHTVSDQSYNPIPHNEEITIEEVSAKMSLPITSLARQSSPYRSRVSILIASHPRLQENFTGCGSRILIPDKQMQVLFARRHDTSWTINRTTYKATVEYISCTKS